MLLLCIKNDTHSLKYMGEPILKALIFKCITLFTSYRNKKRWKRVNTIFFLEIYRIIVTLLMWTVSKTTELYTKKFPKTKHWFLSLPLKMLCCNPTTGYIPWENHNSKRHTCHKVLHNTIYNSQDIKVKGVLNLRHTAA